MKYTIVNSRKYSYYLLKRQFYIILFINIQDEKSSLKLYIHILLLFLVAQEVEGKFLLLKTPCNSDTCPKDPRTGTDKDASTPGTSFHGKTHDASFKKKKATKGPM